MTFLKKLLYRSLPIWILLAGVAGYYFLILSKPVVERREAPVPLLKVEAVRLQPQPYRVTVTTQGTVSARTTGTLIPEVSGKIISVAPNFRDGGFFAEGEVLLEIDPSDYLAALTIAEANLAEARLRLAEEGAAASQALRDWERLGSGEQPSDLVLRKPQLALARANVAASEARVEEARRNVDRTRITAPYQGRVLFQHVDVGQVVTPGTLLAEVYAVDHAEIRLPLTTEEFAALDIPAMGRGGHDNLSLPVTLQARFGPETVRWQGTVVRVEGAVDSRSRQIYVVAQVEDPYGPEHPQPLKVGLFVEARIQGKLLPDVYVLPRTALREGQFVLTIDGENAIQRVPIQPLWSNAEVVVFKEPDIAAGTLASLTQMALAIDGMAVDPVVIGDTDDPEMAEAALARSTSGD